MKTKVLTGLVCIVLALGLNAWARADERPHEGKITSIDKVAMVMTVTGDNDDEWTLYWTETSKLKGDVTVAELQVGDGVHFEFAEKDGKMWLTELRRTKRAKA
ncbi:MAG TPA: hypothetical protein VJS92_15995 [Candidatus Polarisedimenticolaceae bacterium]|nr:hypothetical protein [Candidatus Polarisedimenticolaceae bacterium]